MNFQQLKYAVEVEKAESISKAAKKMFMGQPNVSKSIKELESEIGVTLFVRSPKGVSATVEGKEFLRYARSIVAQVEELQSHYVGQEQRWRSFNVVSTRATYISIGFTNFVNEMLSHPEVHIQYRESNAYTIINLVASGEANVGVLRYNVLHEEYYLEQIAENNLEYEELYSYQMQVMVNQGHPLEKKTSIRYEELRHFMEVRHGDYVQIQNMDEFSAHKNWGNVIYVYDRGSQFDLLRCVDGAYMFISPVSEAFLMKSRFISIPCENAGVYRDLLIYQKGKNEDNYVQMFREGLVKEIQKLKGQEMQEVTGDIIRTIYQ